MKPCKCQDGETCPNCERRIDTEPDRQADRGLDRLLLDDEPWDVGALHEMQYGPHARNW